MIEDEDADFASIVIPTGHHRFLGSAAHLAALSSVAKTAGIPAPVATGASLSTTKKTAVPPGSDPVPETPAAAVPVPDSSLAQPAVESCDPYASESQKLRMGLDSVAKMSGNCKSENPPEGLCVSLKVSVKISKLSIFNLCGWTAAFLLFAALIGMENSSKTEHETMSDRTTKCKRR